jgi:hypothetical protein
MADSLIPITIAVVAAIPGVLAYLSQRKKSEAEAADVLTGAATALIIPLRQEIADLRDELDYLGRVIEMLADWANRLEKQVIDLGALPVPKPLIPPRPRYKTEPIKKEI